MSGPAAIGELGIGWWVRIAVRSRRFESVVVLAALGLVVVGGMLLPPTEWSGSRDRLGTLGDAGFYRAVVARVRAGMAYHEAAREELTSRHYATSSVCNWRTPGYAWLVGGFPGEFEPRLILLAASGVAAVLTFRMVERDFGPATAAAATFLVSGFSAWSVSTDAIVVAEFWAGMALYLSILLRAEGSRAVSVLVGLSALFLRELAAPFCLLALTRAWRSGHRGEAIGWGVGIALYLGHYAWHAGNVARQQATLPPGPITWSRWLDFGGLRFLLATARMNLILAFLPAWCAAFYLPISVLGLWSWKSDRAGLLRSTVLLYLGIFSVAGMPCNDYWGLMNSATLAVGFPIGVLDVLNRIRSLFPPTVQEGIACVVPAESR